MLGAVVGAVGTQEQGCDFLNRLQNFGIRKLLKMLASKAVSVTFFMRNGRAALRGCSCLLRGGCNQ